MSEPLNIKVDLEDPNSVAQAIHTMTTKSEPVQLASFVLSAVHRLGRAEIRAQRTEYLLLAVGAVLGGALAVSVYYNIT